jgi:hypothetical protein
MFSFRNPKCLTLLCSLATVCLVGVANADSVANGGFQDPSHQSECTTYAYTSAAGANFDGMFHNAPPAAPFNSVTLSNSATETSHFQLSPVCALNPDGAGNTISAQAFLAHVPVFHPKQNFYNSYGFNVIQISGSRAHHPAPTYFWPGKSQPHGYSPPPSWGSCSAVPLPSAALGGGALLAVIGMARSRLWRTVLS